MNFLQYLQNLQHDVQDQLRTHMLFQVSFKILLKPCHYKIVISLIMIVFRYSRPSDKGFKDIFLNFKQIQLTFSINMRNITVITIYSINPSYISSLLYELMLLLRNLHGQDLFGVCILNTVYGPKASVVNLLSYFVSFFQQLSTEGTIVYI